jgi:hypothetical protein
VVWRWIDRGAKNWIGRWVDSGIVLSVKKLRNRS